MILTHVKCDFRCHGEKTLFLHWFCKQNEIAYILWFGVLGGLEGALRHACFASCFKTTARIKIFTGHIIFCALVPAGSNLYLLSQRDLEGAQDRFFKKCEILSKTNRKSSKGWIYDLLKHENIQNQSRIISKMNSFKIAQLDPLPRTPKWPFMTASTFALKAQRGSK